MLVVINLKGSEADFIPKIEKMRQEDQKWLAAKHEERKRDRHIEMDLPEVIRLLTAFNEIEKIYFEVR